VIITVYIKQLTLLN